MKIIIALPYVRETGSKTCKTLPKFLTMKLVYMR